MSHTYHLVDDDAETHLWIAQGWPPDSFTLYTGNEGLMRRLKQMLRDGIGHRLRLLDTTEVPETYREIEVDDRHKGDD